MVAEIKKCNNDCESFTPNNDDKVKGCCVYVPDIYEYRGTGEPVMLKTLEVNHNDECEHRLKKK